MINKLFRSRLFYIIVAIALTLALVVVMIVKINQPDENKNALIVLGSSGGMCPDGACGGDNETIYSNGDYSNHKKISTNDMSRIRGLVNDFSDSDYKVNGDCGNSIFDGSDTYLSFPLKYGDRTFETCGIIDSSQSNPLKEILQIIDSY